MWEPAPTFTLASAGPGAQVCARPPSPRATSGLVPRLERQRGWTHEGRPRKAKTRAPRPRHVSARTEGHGVEAGGAAPPVLSALAARSARSRLSSARGTRAGGRVSGVGWRARHPACAPSTGLQAAFDAARPRTLPPKLGQVSFQVGLDTRELLIDLVQACRAHRGAGRSSVRGLQRAAGLLGACSSAEQGRRRAGGRAGGRAAPMWLQSYLLPLSVWSLLSRRCCLADVDFSRPTARRRAELQPAPPAPPLAGGAAESGGALGSVAGRGVTLAGLCSAFPVTNWRIKAGTVDAPLGVDADADAGLTTIEPRRRYCPAPRRR